MDDKSQRGLPSAGLRLPTAGLQTDHGGMLGGTSTCSKPLGTPPRPGRYDAGVDTAPLTPPGSSHNLQLVFDSSKIYENHPRKYRLLLEGGSASVSHHTQAERSVVQLSASENQEKAKAPQHASYTVKGGSVVAMGGSTSTTTTTNTGVSATPSVWSSDPKQPEGQAPGAKAISSNQVSSVAGGQGSGRQQDDTNSGTAGFGAFYSPALFKKNVGDPAADKTAKPHYIPQALLQSFRAKAVQPGASTLPPGGSGQNALPPSDPSPMPSSTSSSTSSLAASGTGGGVPRSQSGQEPQFFPTSQRRGSGPARIPAGCLAIQPEPRRLFGIGPLYRPLQETPCSSHHHHQQQQQLVGKEEFKQAGLTRNKSTSDLIGISASVEQTGITGAGNTGSLRGSVNPIMEEPDSRGSMGSGSGVAAPVGPSSKKKGLTPSELNSWLTGSF